MNNEEIDRELNAHYKSESLKRTSELFTENVMDKIHSIPVVEYKPLISKVGWIGIGVSALLLIVLLVLEVQGLPEVPEVSWRFTLELTRFQWLLAASLSAFLIVQMWLIEQARRAA